MPAYSNAAKTNAPSDVDLLTGVPLGAVRDCLSTGATAAAIRAADRAAQAAANGLAHVPVDSTSDSAVDGVTAGGTDPGSHEPRKRPKPGERRVQILQTLAAMLEQPGAERITTAALAARLDVSEAALYRHFASKAQMFEGLIEFIEASVFNLIRQVTERETDGRVQAARTVALLLQFGEKNPGMTRVMVGDALVFENERLIARMNQFFDRIESQLRQSLRSAADAAGSPTPTVDANVLASVLVSFAQGRLQRFARSGFKRSPAEHLDAALPLLLG
jgi:TetR/AcrR family transcriptional regulator